MTEREEIKKESSRGSWSQSSLREIRGTRIATAALAALVALILITSPALARSFLSGLARGGRWIPENAITDWAGAYPLLLVLGVLGAGMLLGMLWSIWRFLGQIQEGDVFADASLIRLMEIRGFVLAGGAVGVLLGVLYYLPFLLVAGAAFFMALIIGVVRSAFARAIEMREELDLTI